MGKIYQADFGEEESKLKSIPELFDSIQLYRKEGKSISKIHAGFCRSGLWDKSLSSFSHYYYSYRRELNEIGAEDSDGVTLHSPSRAIGRNTAKPAAKSRKQKTGAAKAAQHRSSSEAADAASEIDERTGIKRDLTLEERREISARLFKQKLKK